MRGGLKTNQRTQRKKKTKNRIRQCYHGLKLELGEFACVFGAGGESSGALGVAFSRARISALNFPTGVLLAHIAVLFWPNVGEFKGVPYCTLLSAVWWQWVSGLLCCTFHLCYCSLRGIISI